MVLTILAKCIGHWLIQNFRCTANKGIICMFGWRHHGIQVASLQSKLLHVMQQVFSNWVKNESTDTPFTKMDPDVQFYSSTYYALNTRCDYFIGDTFLTNIAGKNQYKNKLSIFHIKVKSLPKHRDELELYTNSMKFNLSVIALTENWLEESKQDLFDLEGYNCLHKFRKGKRGGGVSLHMENGIDFINRPDLEYFESEMESLFIKAGGGSFNLSSNIIIAVVYRMPNTSLDIFNDLIGNLMNIVTRENKLCDFLGELNIDLLKHENHSPTSEFLDIMYSYSMFPLITKSTRVTKDTATLIYHIFTNNFKSNTKHVHGILCTSISDIMLCSILQEMEARAPCVILNLLYGITCAMLI